jgi:hypothetical protein
MDTGFAYRVKFVDVRVRPPKEDRSRARARATRRCDHAGCDLAGDCRAPVHPDIPNRYYWFCERHAGEYNARWNFFAGKTDAEIEAFQQRAVYGEGPTWAMGQGPMAGARAKAAHDPRAWRGADIFGRAPGASTDAPEPAPVRKLPELAGRAMDELSLEHDATPEAVRARYAELVKRFHPDSNQGERATEDKLARVIRAYKVLRAASLA